MPGDERRAVLAEKHSGRERREVASVPRPNDSSSSQFAILHFTPATGDESFKRKVSERLSLPIVDVDG